ncbi:DMT family transporter [Candidatus Nesciobacter abundans]|uniref:DMT family transporter n=1 Tax=Candidatus Nesciobacter abundans TaxID=2601668 RepID=A0A5C0UJP0_9PROT|nr:DMT family transporter [Candidatus Nesciobacter abundans]QEK39024.1 DMT family transporter [Candidatus Nesciobacter abundans]
MFLKFFENKKNNYIIGAFYFSMSILCGLLNDFIVRYMSFGEMGLAQIMFLRFLFSALSMLPFMIKNKYSTDNYTVHLIRSFLFFVPIVLWNYGVSNGGLIIATFMELSIPVVLLVMAKIFLGEDLKGRILSTILGIASVCFVMFKQLEFGVSVYVVLAFAVAVLCFSSLDIINKKLLNKDNDPLYAFLFYSALGTSLFSLPFAVCTWVSVSYQSIVLCMIQGVSSNLILFFILKAYKKTDVSSLQPIRFISLPISALLSAVFFKERMSWYLVLGFMFLVVSIMMNIKNEVIKKNKI